MVKKLSDIFGIYEEFLEEAIPEADYTTPDPGSYSVNENGLVHPNRAKKLCNQFFDMKYFNCTIHNFYLEYNQKKDALESSNEEFMSLLDQLKEWSRRIKAPATIRDSDSELAKYLNNNCYYTTQRIKDFMDENTEYNPAIITFSNGMYERQSDVNKKLRFNPYPYFIFPELISDFHC